MKKAFLIPGWRRLWGSDVYDVVLLIRLFSQFAFVEAPIISPLSWCTACKVLQHFSISHNTNERLLEGSGARCQSARVVRLFWPNEHLRFLSDTPTFVMSLGVTAVGWETTVLCLVKWVQWRLSDGNGQRNLLYSTGSLLRQFCLLFAKLILWNRTSISVSGALSWATLKQNSPNLVSGSIGARVVPQIKRLLSL